jgi:phage/plasmid-like protein (TIGR03299 family)
MGAYKGIAGGIDTMMSRFEPWHLHYGNEERVHVTDLTIQSGHQALTMAKCDWTVDIEPLSTFMPDYPGAEDHFVTLKNDLRNDSRSVLGVHGERYEPIQNAVIAELADAVMAAVNDSNVISSGALFGGKVVWMLVELPDSGIVLGGREQHKRYVLIVTSHDGSLSLSIRATRVRVECMNTMSMAIDGSRADYVIRHTANALNYVEEAIRGIAMENANAEAWDHRVNELIDTELTTTEFAVNIVPAIMERDRPEKDGRSQTMYDEKFGQIIAAYTAPHNEAIVDTAWGAVNAINEYEAWSIKPRNQELNDRQLAMLVRGDYPLTRKALALVG